MSYTLFNKYTPDGLWWNVGNKYYDFVGGGTDFGRWCGSSCLYLVRTAGYGPWNIGASTALRYTPDSIGWYLEDEYYVYVGSYTYYGTRCGSSQCAFRNPASYANWRVEASNKYTPDAIWKNNSRRSFAIIGGKTYHPYLHTMWGFAYLHLENETNVHTWDIGASGYHHLCIQ